MRGSSQHCAKSSRSKTGRSRIGVEVCSSGSAGRQATFHAEAFEWTGVVEEPWDIPGWLNIRLLLSLNTRRETGTVLASQDSARPSECIRRRQADGPDSL